MSINGDVQFIARPVEIQDESFGGDHLGDVDSSVSSLGQLNLSDSESESQATLSSTSDDESKGDTKPKGRKIRVHHPPKGWTTEEDKEKRRQVVDYKDPGTPVKDDIKDKTWKITDPRDNKEFTYICPPKRKTKPPVVVNVPVPSSSSDSSDENDNDDVTDSKEEKPRLLLVDASEDHSSTDASFGGDPIFNDTFEGDPLPFDGRKLAVQLQSPGGTQTTLNLTPNSQQRFRSMVSEQEKKLENK